MIVQAGNGHANALTLARDYRARGWMPVPIPLKQKGPVIKAWETLRIDANDLSRFFNCRPRNIGVILGEPSGGLVDIDLDHEAAVELAPHFLPPTGSIFGRATKRRAHWLYVVDLPPATRRWTGEAKQVLLEFRSSGVDPFGEFKTCQTVFPGSTHPSGERIEWDSDGEPSRVAASDLMAACERLVAAVKAKLGIVDKEPPRAPTPRVASGRQPDALDRARRYIAKLPRAIARQGGHDATFRTACVLVIDFALSQSDAYQLLAEWNQSHCEPPWTEKELRHKLADADKQPGERGSKLQQEKRRGKRRSQVTIETQFKMTDYGNAERLVNRHGPSMRFCHPWKTWLVWDGRRWCLDDTGEAKRHAKESARHLWDEATAQPDPVSRAVFARFAAASEKLERINAALKLAESEPGIPVLPADLDKDPWLLNCLNGTLDLRDATLRPHNRADLITKLCPVDFDPEAEAARWLSFLHTTFDNKAALISFIQRQAGYCLTGLVREHVLPVYYGHGSNGKSVLLNALLNVLGDDYSMQAPPDLLLVRKKDTHPTDRADLHGKRLVIGIETEDGHRLAESMVKQLTGGDKIRARRMHEDFWQFNATHKVILATNHKPIVRGQDHAIWRRLKLVPFTVTIPDAEQDVALGEKLRAENPGILAWCVRGCLEWQQFGLGEPEDVRQATAEYRSEMDVVGSFINERCIVGPAMKVRAGDLYEAYKAWCTASGEPDIGQKRFGAAMTDKQYERFTSNGKWYQGIGLLTDDPIDPFGD